MAEPTPPPARARFEGAPDRVAVVVPGAGYSPARPLLHFARAVLLARGWTVQELWWQLPADSTGLAPAERTAWVERQVARAVDAEAGACRLLVGKSLGSLAASLAADRALAAAWLTPLLRVGHVTDALRRASAPTLLAGGTGDDLWDSRTAESLPHEVLRVPSADHALELPQDPVGSVRVLHEVVARLDRFAERLAR